MSPRNHDLGTTLFTVSMGLKCISQIITGSLLINDHIYNINGAKCISQIITGSLLINDHIYSIYGAKCISGLKVRVHEIRVHG